MTDIRMADISEFQFNIDAPSYLGGGFEVVICRVHNGNRPDLMMTVRRHYLRSHGFVGIGWYQYLVANRDAADQARDFISVVGSLGANEWPILDLEEGAGDQTGRAQEWFSVVDAWAGFPAMLYSGDSMLTNQLGGSDHWQGRPIWVAAYGQGEPTQAHTLWQFSDAYNFTGIGTCDGSIHHDTAEEFMRSVRGASAPAQKGTYVWTLRDDTSGGCWIADESGAVDAYDGAPYLGGCNNQQYNPDGWPCSGLAQFHDQSGDGYLLTLNAGPDSGGDQYRRYRFPRNGSARV